MDGAALDTEHCETRLHQTKDYIEQDRHITEKPCVIHKTSFLMRLLCLHYLSATLTAPQIFLYKCTHSTPITVICKENTSDETCLKKSNTQ